MASERAVRAALTMLGRVFAGSVGPERIEAYCAALEDIEDAELVEACGVLMRTHAGEFIPVPAVIRKVARGDETPKLDLDRIVRELDRMGGYSPAGGWAAPRVDKVRALAGNAIADAYAEIGGRLFADDQRTRDIAAQEFRKALVSASGASLYASFPPWAVANPPRLAVSEAKQIPAPRGPLAD
jgi:hypothetical protein